MMPYADEAIIIPTNKANINPKPTTAELIKTLSTNSCENSLDGNSYELLRNKTDSSDSTSFENVIEIIKTSCADLNESNLKVSSKNINKSSTSSLRNEKSNDYGKRIKYAATDIEKASTMTGRYSYVILKCFKNSIWIN